MSDVMNFVLKILEIEMEIEGFTLSFMDMCIFVCLAFLVLYFMFQVLE